MDAQTKGHGPLYALFAVLVLSCALGNFSQTATNGMMLAMGGQLGFAPELGQWLTTAYMLVMGITVPCVAFLAKRFSTRNVTCAAIIVFLAGSMFDAMASSFWMLLAGRILQAISTGITLPLMQNLPAMRFPAGQKATAMGIAGIALGFAPNVGPILGGWAAETVGWRVVFIGMATVCLLLVVCNALFSEVDQVTERSASLDTASLVLSTLGFGGLLFGISNASSAGLASPVVWGCAIAGAILIAIFLKRQTKVGKPLINLRILQSKRFVWVLAVQCALLASYMGITLIAPLYWQNVCGGTATEAGLMFVPPTILALILNPLSGYLTDKLGPRPVALAGGTLMAIGATAMCLVDEHSSLAFVTACQTLRGAGMSCLMAPTMAYGLSELRELTPDGSSFLVLVRQACASFGTAVMMLIISALADSASLALPYQAALGFSAVFAIVMLICIAAGIKKTN